MDFLTNPNITYLILVFCFLLAVLALLSPGTGVLELSALFLLLIAGWGVYVNSDLLNVWALAILILGVLPFIYALRRSRRSIYLVIAIDAFVVGSSYLFRSPGDPFWVPGVNPILALVVSLLLAGFLWVAAQKILEAEQARPTHDLAALVGETGEAKTDIKSEGSVQVAGELWSARSEKLIPMGAEVRVIGREGFTLLVEASKDHPGPSS